MTAKEKKETLDAYDRLRKEEPAIQKIETFCCQIRDMTFIDLEILDPDANTKTWISGVPLSCDTKNCLKGPMCLLKAENITVQGPR